VTAQAATALGLRQDASKYGDLFAEIKAAFNREFVTPSGYIHSDAQTVYSLAIMWDLLESERQGAEAGRRLADLVRASGFRISTGFVGTPLVCDALTRTGHVDVAYRLLFQTRCPSWLYPVTMGATTIWERWDSMLPDGSINPGGMTSFNHYALGAVADWLHRTVAGLSFTAPGYRRILLQPRPTPHLMQAATRHLTPYGEASIAWTRQDGRLRIDARVPVGVTAEVVLPGMPGETEVSHGSHRWDLPDPFRPAPQSPIDWSLGTVRDVLDDPMTWRRVADAATRTGVVAAGETEAARMLTHYLDSPATRLASALAPDDRFPGAMELRNEVAAILAGAPRQDEPATHQ